MHAFSEIKSILSKIDSNKLSAGLGQYQIDWMWETDLI